MKVIRIGEAADRIGVSVQTLKTLEKKGAFRAARDWSGQRVFSEQDLVRISEKIFPRGVQLRQG